MPRGPASSRRPGGLWAVPVPAVALLLLGALLPPASGDDCGPAPSRSEVVGSPYEDARALFEAWRPCPPSGFGSVEPDVRTDPQPVPEVPDPVIVVEVVIGAAEPGDVGTGDAETGDAEESGPVIEVVPPLRGAADVLHLPGRAPGVGPSLSGIVPVTLVLGVAAPDLRGMTAADARARLSSLRLRTATTPAEGDGDETVSTQRPEPGTPVAFDGTVTVDLDGPGGGGEGAGSGEGAEGAGDTGTSGSVAEGDGTGWVPVVAVLAGLALLALVALRLLTHRTARGRTPAPPGGRVHAEARTGAPPTVTVTDVPGVPPDRDSATEHAPPDATHTVRLVSRPRGPAVSVEEVPR